MVRVRLWNNPQASMRRMFSIGFAATARRSRGTIDTANRTTSPSMASNTATRQIAFEVSIPGSVPSAAPFHRRADKPGNIERTVAGAAADGSMQLPVRCRADASARSGFATAP